MSYIDWSTALENLDLGFLQPLLQAVSSTYQNQWETTLNQLKGSDPYGSSIGEERITSAKADLDSAAAKTKSDMIMQYYRANQHKKLTDELEKQREEYEDIISDLKEKYNRITGGINPPGYPVGTVVNPGAIGAGPPDMSTFGSSYSWWGTPSRKSSYYNKSSYYTKRKKSGGYYY